MTVHYVSLIKVLDDGATQSRTWEISAKRARALASQLGAPIAVQDASPDAAREAAVLAQKLPTQYGEAAYEPTGG